MEVPRKVWSMFIWFLNRVKEYDLLYHSLYGTIEMGIAATNLNLQGE